MNTLQKIQNFNKNRSNLILKAFGIEDSFEKARAGTYENTPENRKLGRVGQKYGSKKEEINENNKIKIDLIRKKDPKFIFEIRNEQIKFKSFYNEFVLNIKNSINETIDKGLNKIERLILLAKNRESKEYFVNVDIAVMDLLLKSKLKVKKINKAQNQNSTYITFNNGKKVRISNHTSNNFLGDVNFNYSQETKDKYENELNRVLKELED